MVRNLEKLTAGLWIFIEHPGREVGEMQAMGHYAVVSQRRGRPGGGDAAVHE